MLNVSVIELAWIAINLTTFVLTITAFFDARADRVAVKLLNGHARELVADGIVRREVVRLVVQTLLLSLAIPAILSDRPTNLSFGVVALMSVAVLLAVQSFLDARERKRLTAAVAADALTERSSEYETLVAQLTENTRISQQASDHADKAYHEANSVNEKIAAHGAVLVKQGQDMAADRERNAASDVTIETTAEEVHDLHEGTAPEKAS